MSEQLFKNKSQMARLLAQENILIEHRKSSTAYFDLATRTMVLPMWKEMDGELYDLLMGHEIGHALYTPKQGWHDAVTANKSMKSYLNVIEDARIERQVKAKFPGIIKSFNNAYKKLYEDDFFGIKDRDVSKFRLIDRINIFYKLGAHINVPFTEEELKFIDRINAAQSWEDVESISNEVYAYAKTEKRDRPDMNDFDGIDMSDDSEDSDDDYDDFDMDSEDSDYDETDELEESEEFDQKKRKTSGKNASKNNQNKEQEEDLSSETDNAFRNNEHRLLDDSKGETHICNVPTADLKSIVIPHAKVQSLISDHYRQLNKAYPMIEQHNKERLVELFNRTNPTINYMIKEFEMRKNASQLARAKVAKSGKINPKKLARAGIDPDIFQRVTSVAEGKNHGMIMIIDLSGSMTDILLHTFEQSIVLAQFCRKLNIPFDVYGFSDDFHVSNINKFKNNVFSGDVNDLIAHAPATFRLKQYLSSNMNTIKFREAAANMLAVGYYTKNRYNYYKEQMIPSSENLNGTPLDEAVIASIPLVEEFKQINRLDIVNCIFLTDGAGTQCSQYTKTSNDRYGYGWFDANRDSVYFQTKSGDVRVKLQNLSKGRSNDYFITTRALVQIAQKVTGAKYTGYYMGRPRDIASMNALYEYTYVDYRVEKEQLNAYTKKIKLNGFVSSEKFGFEEFFFVMSDNLKIEEAGFEVAADASKNKIAKEFMKSMNGRGLQRMFLNQFVQNLAA